MDLILFAVACPLFQTETHFFPPPSPVGKCKVIISNVQRAFHLHFMVSGAISKLEWEFVHAALRLLSVADEIISEKSGG